jgi:aladin
VFHLWETSKWMSAPWSSAGGSVVSVMWNPDGKVLLAGFNGTTSLAALHFAGRPPSLDVHLLPLDLPDLEAITGGHGTIERMAWDGTGERLAVAFGGVVDSVYDGLVALFDTRQTPIVSMSLL